MSCSCPPSSSTSTGLATYEVFLRGTLDKIGALPELLHIGDYKTAPNHFTEKTFTPAHREMSESLNHDVFEQLVGRWPAGARRRPEVRGAGRRGAVLAEDALQAGLVDDVAYCDEIGKTSGLRDRSRTLPLEQYLPRSRPRVRPRRARIAVINAVGTIDSGGGGDRLNGAVVGSDTLVEYIRKARNDDSIKAVVLRIDSPGGSTVASDVIWRELMLLRARKPLVVSMSDLAASGGYYIAMPGHVIVAQPGTLTGLDRHLHRQDRHRRHATEARHEHRGGQRGQARGDELAGAPLQRGRARQARGAAAGLLRPVRREGRRVANLDARGDRRHRAGPRVDRPPGKERGLVDELGGLAAGARHREAAREHRRGSACRSSSTRPKRTVFEALSSLGGAQGDARGAGRAL